MNQKNEQLLKITPESELVFRGTFLTPVTSQILLQNPTSMSMAFKIKTTTPKQYCVKPNFGFVKPGETVTISIILQPFKYSPNEKYRHKFMVQSVIHEDDSTGQVPWEKFSAKDLMDSKLLCVFEHLDDRGHATDANDATESSTVGVVSSSAPITAFGSPEKSNDEMHYKATGSSSSSSSMMMSGGSSSGGGNSSAIGSGIGSGDVRSQSTNGALFDFSECHSKTVGDNDHYKTVDNRTRYDSVIAKEEELNSLREELSLMKREQKKLMVELSKARSKDLQNNQRMETSNCVMNAPVQYVVCAIAICFFSYLFGRYF